VAAYCSRIAAGLYDYFVFGISDALSLGSKLVLTIFVALALGQILAIQEKQGSL